MSHPTDNLVRSRYDSEAVCLRAAVDEASDGRKLFGHFAVFDRWTEIDSWYEGRFLERLADTAFKRTFKERADKVRVLYEHGADPFIGNKPIAVPTMLRSDKGVGAYYEADLFEAGYVDELLPALRAGQLGASFRFRIVAESWVDPKKATDHNPNMLPERTITDVDLYEFGPVTFGAYEDATSGVRSGSDRFVNHLLNDPTFVARFTERAGLAVVERVLASLPADGRSQAPAPVPADGRSEAQQPTIPVSLLRARALQALNVA